MEVPETPQILIVYYYRMCRGGKATFQHRYPLLCSMHLPPHPTPTHPPTYTPTPTIRDCRCCFCSDAAVQVKLEDRVLLQLCSACKSCLLLEASPSDKRGSSISRLQPLQHGALGMLQSVTRRLLLLLLGRPTDIFYESETARLQRRRQCVSCYVLLFCEPFCVERQPPPVSSDEQCPFDISLFCITP